MGVEQWKPKPVRSSTDPHNIKLIHSRHTRIGKQLPEIHPLCSAGNVLINNVICKIFAPPAAAHLTPLFNPPPGSSGVSKRTSSSSGFSSARSERSDSSTSVCSDAKPPPLPPHQSLPVSTSSSSSDQASHADVQQGGAPPPAKPQGLRGIRIEACLPASGKRDDLTNAASLPYRSKFSKSSNKDSKESPKSSRKEKEREEREGSRGSPRGGHKAHRDPRAERGESRERSGREERSGKKSEKLTLELDGGSRSRSQPPQHSLPDQAKESRVAASRQDASAQFADLHVPPALPPKENSHKDNSTMLVEQNSVAMQQQQHHHHHQQQQQHQQQGDPGIATTPGSPLPPGTPGTGIPKPTAHVKGQTKAAPPERTGPTTPTSSPNVNTPHQAKDYNKMVRHQSSSSTSKGSSSSGASRSTSTPAGVDPNCPQEPRDPKGSLPRQKQLGRREEPSSGISVALVSPMPIPREKDHLVTPSESGSNISESSQSNSGHSNSNSSGNSSVIYKPTSSEDDSVTDYKMGKVDERPEGEEGDEVILNIKPMQPLVRTSQYGYMRGLGLHQARTVPPSLHVSRLALQETANTVPQKGMRLGPHLKRPPGNNQVLDGDYSDLESVELTNGYMSDGDVLRNVGYRSGNSSDLDGYMSEGGASLYAHRLNQRFKEGMRQVHESMNKVQHFIQDDSLFFGVNAILSPSVLLTNFPLHSGTRSGGTEDTEEGSSLPASTPSSEPPSPFDEGGVLDEDVKSKDAGEETSVFNDKRKAEGNTPEEKEGGEGGGGIGGDSGGVKR
ncbi:hypothetical protein E2C01_031633 [Portunus trituberculatus]|uniref:Uncharacterized protein n=1 Tax=Portunus trituberculatus TaxID=210409 RepID=A0A5B7EY73_PORTR|nr:hypothetical protein [Portunus trituberculatus]